MGTLSSHPHPQRGGARPSFPVPPPPQPLQQPLLCPPASFPLTPSVSPHPSPTRTTVNSQSAPASQASSTFSSPSSSASSSPLPAAAAPSDLRTCTRISCCGQLRLQYCWECLDCQLTNELLLCLYCRNHCHAGHRLMLKGRGWHAGVCDCSSNKKQRCTAPAARLLPLAMQRAPSAPGQSGAVSTSRLQLQAGQRDPHAAAAAADGALPGPPRMVSAQTLPLHPPSVGLGFTAQPPPSPTPPSLPALAGRQSPPVLAGRQSPSSPGPDLEVFNSVSVMDEFKQPQQPRRSSFSGASPVPIPAPFFAGRASSQPALLLPLLPLQSQRPARSMPVLEEDIGGLEPPEPTPTRSFVMLGQQTHEVQPAATPPALLQQQKPHRADCFSSSEEGQGAAASTTGEVLTGESGQQREGEEGQTGQEGEPEQQQDKKEEGEGESHCGQEGEGGTSTSRDDATEQQVEGRPHPSLQARRGDRPTAGGEGCVVLLHPAVLSDEAPVASRSFSTPHPHFTQPSSRSSSAAVAAASAPAPPIARPSSGRSGPMPRSALIAPSSLSPLPWSLGAGPPALERTTSLPAQPSNVDLSDVIRRYYPTLYAKLPPEDWQSLAAHPVAEATGEAPLPQHSSACRHCRQREAVCLLPCGHRCLCTECIWSFDYAVGCPVCRRLQSLQTLSAAQQS